MKPQGMHLVWITVSDIKKAIKFYTEILGFTLSEFNETFGWAELSTGPDGITLGLAQYDPNESSCSYKPGSNAIPTITVTDLEESRKELIAKQTQFVGDVLEIPGEVKMQTFTDVDGNVFQLVQLLK